MARDILGEYGRDTPKPQRAPASSGGVMSVKEIPYSAPQGPIGINNPQTPGLHGSNHGNSQQCRADGGSGSVGLHGTNRGNKGSQR